MAYLNQIHSAEVVRATDSLHVPLNADASWDNTGKVACAVMTADCLPVLFCDCAGTVVAAAHAGWRGLANGVLQNTVAAMGVEPVELMAYFAPAISAEAFEVGEDVLDSFPLDKAEQAFICSPNRFCNTKALRKFQGANIVPYWNAMRFSRIGAMVKLAEWSVPFG